MTRNTPESALLEVGRCAGLALGVLMGLAPHAQAAANPNFHIYLAFGQSNMEGQAPPESQDQVANSRFKSLVACTCTGRTLGQWIPAVAPIVRPDTYLGPLDWFGRNMADSLPLTDTIGVVAVAVAGTPILGFMPNQVGKAYYAGLQPSSKDYYQKNIATEYGGDPYARLVATAKTAQQSGVIKGILLHQGETDAGSNSLWGDSVKTIYNSLLNDLSLTASAVPLLAGEVYSSNSHAIATIDKLPQTIATAYVISSQGLTIGTYANNQGVHFSAASYRTLGQRYAQQMLKLLPKSTSLAPSARPNIPGLRVESSAQGIAIHSDAALDRVSLVSIQGQEVVVGSGNDIRILPGQFHPGVYFLHAVTGAASETSKVLVQR